MNYSKPSNDETCEASTVVLTVLTAYRGIEKSKQDMPYYVADTDKAAQTPTVMNALSDGVHSGSRLAPVFPPPTVEETPGIVRLTRSFSE